MKSDSFEFKRGDVVKIRGSSSGFVVVRLLEDLDDGEICVNIISMTNSGVMSAYVPQHTIYKVSFNTSPTTIE